MQTIIRLSLCILLGVPALVVLLLTVAFLCSLGSGYFAYRTVSHTTCAQFIALMDSSDTASKNTFHQTVRRAENSTVAMWDAAFARSGTNYREAIDVCLDHPTLNMRNALTGEDPDGVGGRMTESLVEIRRKRANPGPNPSTPTPSSAKVSDTLVPQTTPQTAE